MNLDDIRSLDKSRMYDLVKNFPAQVREAIGIGNHARIALNVRGIENIVLSGLGGSAIGGDLLRSFLAGELNVPFLVNRHYALPAYVGPKSLVIISSYSGNTEETNAAYRAAVKRKAKILCISSNGMTEELAKRNDSPMIKVPGGLPPRAALGYSFFPLLIVLTRLGLVKNKKRAIDEAVRLLDKKSAEYGNPESATNAALQLARQMQGRISVVYSASERFDAVNTRWRGQIAENAKALAFGHVLPEMNHNELVGWKVLKAQMSEMQVFFLRDKADHRRVQLRMDITKQLVHEHTANVTEVWSEGTSPLTRMFSLVYLGDWVSFYLAMLHRVDPTPVSVIDYLKEELANVRGRS